MPSCHHLQPRPKPARLVSATPLLATHRSGGDADAFEELKRRLARRGRVKLTPHRTSTAISLTLHAAVVLCLLTAYPLQQLTSPPISYDVIVVADTTQRVAAPTPPANAEQQAGATPVPDAEMPQVVQPAPAPPPPAAITTAEPPEPTPPRALIEPLPSHQTAMVPEPKAVARPHGHVLASAPLPYRHQPASVAPISPQAGPPPSPQAADPEPIWLEHVSQWLMTHQLYPETARRRREQGTVVVKFAADRTGRVLDASLVHGSGSALLDEAALALLRGASLPAFPSNMPSPQQTVTVPISYRLQ
jgi:protein TonB